MLLTVGAVLAGFFAYLKLPVAPLPQIDFPTITACCDAHLGVIADVNEMTSQNTVGQTRITLQFGLDRDLGGAGLTEKPE